METASSVQCQSVLLFGNEEYAEQLRLASVLHAVTHFEHYLEMVYIDLFCEVMFDSAYS